MNYKFLPEAEIELDQTIAHYESCQNGLGEDFKIELLRAIKNVMGFPKAWTKISPECRRVLLNRFPYGIIYSIEEDFILIISIMNLHRKPGYWKDRTKTVAAP